MTDYPDIKRNTRWGEVPARQWMNLIRDVESMAHETVTAPLVRQATPSGRRLSIVQAKVARTPPSIVPAAAASIRSAKLRIVYDDTLLVDPWNPETETWDITQALQVAKPWDLQKTPWHSTAANPITWGGIIYTYSAIPQRRHATDGGQNAHTEIIIPRYLSNQIIKIRAVDWTGVPDPNDPTKLLTVEDANAAGRAWARLNTE